MRALEAELASIRRSDELAVMFIDFDEFKQVNDLHGHAAGDKMLSVVARRLNGAVREGDLVGRIGGDEFLVVCPDIAGAKQVVQLAKRLEDALRAPVKVGRASLRPQVSIGFACSGSSALDADSLVAEADHAMYEAKRSRRRRAAKTAPARSLPSRAGRGETREVHC